jgi:hypothetical protein
MKRADLMPEMHLLAARLLVNASQCHSADNLQGWRRRRVCVVGLFWQLLQWQPLQRGPVTWVLLLLLLLPDPFATRGLIRSRHPGHCLHDRLRCGPKDLQRRGPTTRIQCWWNDGHAAAAERAPDQRLLSAERLQLPAGREGRDL